MEIPIVDLGNHGTSPTDLSIAEAFTNALTNFGFTYIVNHGISTDQVKRAFEVSKQFFELDKAAKCAYFADAENHYHGYNHRQLNISSKVQDMREIFDCCGVSRRYPSEVPDFQVAMENLEAESKSLVKKLLRLLARALELQDIDYFTNSSKYLDDPSVSSSSTFRSLYYRGISPEIAIPPGTVRTKEHTDHGLLTLLFQDGIGGLEIRAKDGRWIPATPIENSLIVNTGDLLAVWTGGLIPATPHRVMIPEKNQRASRQSLAYFVHPDDSTLISPIASPKITYENTFTPFMSYEFAMKQMQRTY